jgi:hypothetical protein
VDKGSDAKALTDRSSDERILFPESQMAWEVPVFFSLPGYTAAAGDFADSPNIAMVQPGPVRGDL